MAMLDNLKSWLSWHYYFDGGGAALWEGLGLTADDLSDLLRQALRTRFPSVAPLDALPEILFNENLDPPQIATPALRIYAGDPWTKWRHAGSRFRFYEELALYGCTTATIVSWRNLADGGNPGAFGGDTTCWYLDLGTAHPFLDPDVWDGGALWDGGSTWDLKDPTRLLPLLMRLIAKWKPAASSCRFIQMTLPSGAVVRVPVLEWWEITNGAFVDYYNYGY